MVTRCKQIQDWVETEVWDPVDDWVKSTEQRCKDYGWWNPLGWFCWLVTIFVKIVIFVMRKIVTPILRVVCEVVNLLLELLSAVLNVVLAIPFIGAAIRIVIRAFVSAVSYVVGLADGIARALGIRITKHLRVHVIPLCEGTVPLAYEGHLAQIMRETERILYARAQIRMHTTFHEPYLNPPENALRLGTNADLIADELWLKGSWHQLQTVKLFEDSLWSLVSLGQPVVVYIVREVGYDGPGTVVGASGGPFFDWIAVERDLVVPLVVADATGAAAKPLAPYPPVMASSTPTKPAANPSYSQRVVAHELCHALGLLGHANAASGDLMVPGNISGDALSPFQVGIVRSSRHVTFV